MTLTEFFEFDANAPVDQAFQAVRQAFDRHMKSLDAQQYSPWTLKLGKGGLKPDGSPYPGPEQSLYRHCMEVAIFGTWLFYHAWRAGRLPLAPTADPVPALHDLFAIAFAHDADKRMGGKSRSPTAEDVQQVYEELDLASWSSLRPGEMCTAVSLVENRGLGRAVFGDALLTPLMNKLAELVHQGDNLLSRTARKGGGAKELLTEFNATLSQWHALYAVPNQSLRLLRFRHHPIVIHSLHEFLGYRFFNEAEFYPLLFVRRGELLEIGVPEELMPKFGAWLDQFEDYLADTDPSLKVSAPKGTVALFNIGNTADLLKAVLGNTRQAELLLRVASKDWEMVIPLVNFWVMQCGAPLATAAPKGSLCPVLKADGEVSARHAFWRAAALVVAQATGGKESTAKLLAENGVVQGLQRTGIVVEKLEALTLRTATALQASLLIHEEVELQECLDRIHGPWEKRADQDPGAHAIVVTLKEQIGDALSEETHSPYVKPTNGGICLLCGSPAERYIESGSMKLAGIRVSSFNNRIGHEKHLWSEKGENYLCPACLRIQGLLLERQPKLLRTPLLIATPVRHLLDTHGGDREKNILRSYDAVSREGHHKIFPWNADASFDAPLLFEERPTGFLKTIDHIYRLACYAAWSGEPVHAFISNQRECMLAFLYEGMPELVKELLHDMNIEGDAISHLYLEQLVRRLEMFHALLNENDGMAGMQALPRFGWWAVAFVLIRAARREKDGWNSRSIHYFELAQKEYPMNEYDQWLDSLVQHSVDIHKPRSDASGAEWGLILRTALETYQKHYQFGPQATRDAIAQMLRANLSRRLQENLYKKDLDERLQSLAEAAYALLEKAAGEFDLESGFLRFLFAAYEGGYRRQVAKYWKQSKATT